MAAALAAACAVTTAQYQAAVGDWVDQAMPWKDVSQRWPRVPVRSHWENWRSARGAGCGSSESSQAVSGAEEIFGRLVGGCALSVWEAGFVAAEEEGRWGAA